MNADAAGHVFFVPPGPIPLLLPSRLRSAGAIEARLVVGHVAGVSYEGFLVRLLADLTLRAQVLGHIPDAHIYAPGDFIMAAVAPPAQWASRNAYRLFGMA